MIRRYAYGDFGMDLLDDGELVLHSDYATLERELTELREAVKKMLSAHKAWQQKANASYSD